MLEDGDIINIDVTVYLNVSSPALLSMALLVQASTCQITQLAVLSPSSTNLGMKHLPHHDSWLNAWHVYMHVTASVTQVASDQATWRAFQLSRSFTLWQQSLPCNEGTISVQHLYCPQFVMHALKARCTY